MLISAYKKLTADKFCKLIKSVESVSVRYNIIGSRQANIQDKIYNNIAIKVHNNELSNINSINNALKSSYPNDEDFKEDFRVKSMRTLQSPKKARYLLSEIEVAIDPNSAIDSSLLTLEHILPESPDGEWIDSFGKGDYNEHIDRLGNMTLVSKELNQELNRKNFNEKKKILKVSKQKITEKIQEYETWNSETVNDRQNWMATYAVQKWKIQFN